MIPQRAYVDFPTQSVNTFRGIRNVSSVIPSAKLFGGRDPADYPVAGRIYANCMAIEAFAAEHPLRQPDAQAEARV